MASFIYSKISVQVPKNIRETSLKYLMTLEICACLGEQLTVRPSRYLFIESR